MYLHHCLSKLKKTTCRYTYEFNDAMPVSFGQNCLHLLFQPYLSNQTYSRKREKLPNVVRGAC